MKATKNWGQCACECGKIIGVGEEMIILDGCVFLAGHEPQEIKKDDKEVPALEMKIQQLSIF